MAEAPRNAGPDGTFDGSAPRPNRGARFAFGPIERRESAIDFHFFCSTFGEFIETVEVAGGRAGDPLLRLLHVALGVSTYKAAAAEAVAFPPLTPAGRAMAEALFTDGLAEFFVRSGLSYPPETAFEGEILDAPRKQAEPPSGPPLVAFGGGKDSYVAGEILRAATGEEPRFASVILSEAVGEVLTQTAPAPPLLIRRRLDPKLLTLDGAFAGHVPITAINMLVMVLAGMERGASAILFANERSADEPTIKLRQGEANHQFSKSSRFEELIRAAIAEGDSSAPPVYSVLRPFSELWIAERFAKISAALPRFTSCNRNFRLAGDASKRWCGSCAKCAFTSLIVSPFLTRREAETAFGQSLLDQQELLPYWEELCGLSDKKPWDCVGTIAESQAALALLKSSETWKEALVVRMLWPRLSALKTDAQLDAQIEEARKPDQRGALPEALFSAALRI